MRGCRRSKPRHAIPSFGASQDSLVAYGVTQKGVGTSTGVTFGAASTAGTTLVFYVTSASATPPTVSTAGVSVPLFNGYYSNGHGSTLAYTGIFYVRGVDNPGGITGFTTSGITICYYREISGIPPNPIVNWNFGGNTTAGTSFSIPVAGVSVAGDFITDVLQYSASNAGAAKADGWTDTTVAGNNAQTSYNGTTNTAGSGTMSSGTYDVSSLDFGQIDNSG